MPTVATFIQQSIRTPTQSKKKKRHPNQKRKSESKTYFLQLTYYIEKTLKTPPKQLKLRNKFSKVPEYKTNNRKKSVGFYTLITKYEKIRKTPIIKKSH